MVTATNVSSTMNSMKESTCFPPPMHAVSNGLFQGDIPLNFALPLLILQITVVLVVTRTLACIFRRIRQPRVLAEIIGGVLLGPTALGRNATFRNAVFPAQSIPLLETVATMGLMFFIFIVGLQLDLSALRRSGKSALLIAISGIAAPFAASAAVAPLVLRSITASPPPRVGPLIVFVGTPLSISAFSVLVRVMAELGMLSSDVAKLAVPSAAVNDVSVWTLLAVGVAIAGPNSDPLVPLWVLISGAAFAVAMVGVGRGLMAAVARRAMRSDGGATDVYVCITLTAVLLAGFASDAIGVHPLLGPFFLGAFMVKDNEFPAMIVEKTEDFVTGLMLPLFFASSGLKTDLSTLHGVASVGFLALFFAAAGVGKIGGTFLAARLCGLPIRRALVLGFLMNTKGLAVLIVLNVGKDLHVLNDELFAILVLTCLLTSFLTFPTVSALWGVKGDAASDAGNFLGDAEQSSGGSAAGNSSSATNCSVDAVERAHRQLRLLITMGGVSDDRQYVAAAALVDVIEAARGSRSKAGASSPLKLYNLSLEPMSDRSSAILKLLRRSSIKTYFGSGSGGGGPAECWKSGRSPPPFVPSFGASDVLSKVVVRSMNAISELDEMHHAIARAAAKKKAAMIILPWLRHSSPDGFGADRDGKQSLPTAYRRLLDQHQQLPWPCSVAILVISGTRTSDVRPSCSFRPYQVAVLFSGGADDREALALACRMSEHPGIHLRVIRFVIAQQASAATAKLRLSAQQLSEDNDAISKLKEKAAAAAAAAVRYEEEQVEEAAVEEAVKRVAEPLIREANLVVMGRRWWLDVADGGGREGLGSYGEIVARAGGREAEEACLLVVQQNYGGGGGGGSGGGAGDKI